MNATAANKAGVFLYSFLAVQVCPPPISGRCIQISERSDGQTLELLPVCSCTLQGRWLEWILLCLLPAAVCARLLTSSFHLMEVPNSCHLT